MIDVNAWMDKALNGLGVAISEEPIHEVVPPEQPYITWLQGKTSESRSSGIVRFVRHEVHVYLWIPDGTQWNGLLAAVADAFKAHGALGCQMQGMSHFPDIQRKLVQLNLILREDALRERVV